jgi:hypothetical protein
MPALVIDVDGYWSSEGVKNDFGVTDAVQHKKYTLQVIYEPRDESISANGKKWKMSHPVSELSEPAKKTWNHFLSNKPTFVIYHCRSSFNIGIWRSDRVNYPESIELYLQTPSSTMETLARFVSILDAQE